MPSDLASLLLSEQILAASDLERIEAERATAPLWAALRDAELATEEQIHAILLAGGAFPAVSDEQLATATPPAALFTALPAALALASGLLPLELFADRREAIVAMVDPSDTVTLDAYRAAAGLSIIRPLLAHPRALQAAIRRTYGITSGSVELDPSLADELAHLPPGALLVTPSGPLRSQRTTPPRDEPTSLEDPRDASRYARKEGRKVPLDESHAADHRLIRALTEVIEALAAALEARLGARPRAQELARLSRRVARRLDCPRPEVDEISVVATLFAVDRALRLSQGHPVAPLGTGAGDLLESLGWAAAAPGGIAPALRSLLAASSTFGLAGSSAPPLAARVVSACADYLELEGEAGAPPDRDTVSQLLRAGPATAPVVDALLRVLETNDLDPPAAHAAGTKE